MDEQAIRELRQAVEELKVELALHRQWLEGTVVNGIRHPGIIDHVTAWRNWKNWVLALLGTIATAVVTELVRDILGVKR